MILCKFAKVDRLPSRWTGTRGSAGVIGLVYPTYSYNRSGFSRTGEKSGTMLAETKWAAAALIVRHARLRPGISMQSALKLEEDCHSTPKT